MWYDKLLKCNVGSNFYNIVKDMYKKVSSQVRVRNNFTVPIIPKCGLRQGDVLSPLLFNLYIHDIVNIFDDSCEPPTLENFVVNCLMYADDMVLLSTTKSGLQNSIDKFSIYCNKWKLNVNLNKTKIVKFCKRQNSEVAEWHWNGNKIEVTDSYSYLGTVMSGNTKYQKARENIKNKALKAVFSLIKCSQGSDMPVKIGLDLFDKLVKPVMLYGSEFCILPDNVKILEKKPLKEIYADGSNWQIPSENICTRFARNILGVHRKSSILCLRGELGTYPIYIDMIVQMVKYWQRIAMLNSGTLMEAAYIEQKHMVNKKECWLYGVTKILEQVNLCTYIDQPDFCDPIYIKSKLRERYQEFWKNKLWNDERKKGGNKLRSYREFKRDIKFEGYLNEIKIFNHRSDLTKLRCSAHKLNIEKGRYKKPIVPVEERICTKCNKGEIEDEFHLFVCDFYKDLREELGINISDKKEFFQVMEDCNYNTAVYVNKCFRRREGV